MPNGTQAHLLCDTCGARAVHLLPVELHYESDFAADLGGDFDEQESRFHTCQVCGDNWLTVEQVSEAEKTVTVVHQMGMSPALKRIGAIPAGENLLGTFLGTWEYFLDDEAVAEADWFSNLAERRRMLRSMSLN